MSKLLNPAGNKFVSINLDQKQELLETKSLIERSKKILSHLDEQLDLTKVEKRVRGRVKKQMEKSQKEYYLNEQMKALKKELDKINLGIQSVGREAPSSGHEEEDRDGRPDRG